MTRRSSLSDKNLSKVIRLRQARVSWVEIQRQTKIDRRTAKRAYEDWQQSQSVEELKTVRKDVAADEFRKHLYCLIKLAQWLVIGLHVPKSPNETNRAQDVLNSLLQRDVMGECSPYGLPGTRGKADTDDNIRLNRLLFQSLKTHTPELRWDAFTEWGGAWDKCIQALGKLRGGAREIVGNILNQKVVLAGRIREESGKKDVNERIVKGVLHMVWQHLSNPDQGFPLADTTLRSDGRIEVTFGKDSLSVGIILPEMSLAKEVVVICTWAAQNLDKEDTTRTIATEISTMHGRAEELLRMLNPLVLGPRILRTRCELCPA